MRDFGMMWENHETIISAHSRRNRIILFVLLTFLIFNLNSYLNLGYADTLRKGYVVICQDGKEVQKILVPILGRKVVKFPLHYKGKYELFSLEIVNGSVRVRENIFCKIQTNTNKEWIRRSDETIRIEHLNVKIFITH